MNLQVIALDRIQPQPWRNGGGETRELFTWPPGGPWSVRISVAEIRADGPFSPFPGVQRWFAVVEGDGVVLQFRTHRELLDADGAPLHFDGADAPHCTLPGGPTRDLNLMLRSDAGHGTLQRVQADDEWFSRAPLRALFSAEPALLQIDDNDAARLPAFGLAVSTHGARQRWRVAGGEARHAWWMAFEPKGQT